MVDRVALCPSIGFPPHFLEAACQVPPAEPQHRNKRAKSRSSAISDPQQKQADVAAEIGVNRSAKRGLLRPCRNPSQVSRILCSRIREVRCRSEYGIIPLLGDASIDQFVMPITSLVRMSV
jgi:hypothetical protein